MSRAVLILANDAIRERAIKWIKGAPDRTRVEFKEPKRTTDQNAKMWAMLSDIARQKEHTGRKYTTEDWKCLFMHALGQELRFVPSLDMKTFLPLGFRSSELSVQEMRDLIELMYAYGAEHNVKWSDDRAKV